METIYLLLITLNLVAGLYLFNYNIANYDPEGYHKMLIGKLLLNGICFVLAPTIFGKLIWAMILYQDYCRMEKNKNENS